MSNILVAGLSFIVSFVSYPLFIKFLNQRQHQQIVSEYSLDSFKAKAKTPSLGGVVFVLVPVAVFMTVFPQALLKAEVLLLLLVYLAYGLIGFVDDYKIILEKNNKGISVRLKFFLQLMLAAVFYFFFQQYLSSSITIYGLNWTFELGILYFAFVLFVFTGSSNAVNLTDGMDGLAGGTSLIALLPFAVFAYRQGNLEIFAIVLALMGSLVAYLWYNRHPARIFMGDTGSLALGAILAALAIVLKQEFSFIFIAGVFIFETLCVMIQIGSVKLFKRRVFKFTPIHYSFTLSGWKERNVVRFFWMMGLVFMMIGLFLGVLK